MSRTPQKARAPWLSAYIRAKRSRGEAEFTAAISLLNWGPQQDADVGAHRTSANVRRFVSPELDRILILRKINGALYCYSGDGRFFASSAERPGNGSPRTAMFGVCSTLQALSRSAQTSRGAVRASTTVSPSSVTSASQRRDPRISNPPSLAKLSAKRLARLRLDCVRTRAKQDGS